MPELIYQRSLFALAVLLLLAVLLATELGFHLGRRHAGETNEQASTLRSTLNGALLGLLGLLLGFTFSMAVSRFDARRLLVLQEANAIGTTFLRTRFLPEAERTASDHLLHRYVELRLEIHHTIEQGGSVTADLAETEQLQRALWALATSAATGDSRSQPIALYVTSLNEMIDLHAARVAASTGHVPETVLYLLFGLAVGTSGLIGYSCGLAGQRSGISTTLFSCLIVFVISVILDIDRPRQGLIRENQQPLVDLQQSMRSPPDTGSD